MKCASRKISSNTFITLCLLQSVCVQFTVSKQGNMDYFSMQISSTAFKNTPIILCCEVHDASWDSTTALLWVSNKRRQIWGSNEMTFTLEINSDWASIPLWLDTMSMSWKVNRHTTSHPRNQGRASHQAIHTLFLGIVILILVIINFY